MATIELNGDKYAIVDDSDFAFLSQWKWGLANNGYVTRYVFVDGKKHWINMHRQIFGCPLNKMIDHINGNTLDNRKENLRICTNSQNQANRKRMSQNTSGFKGVSWNKGVGKWQAAIKRNGKNFHLGIFHTPEEAHKEYLRAASSLFGEFASGEIFE